MIFAQNKQPDILYKQATSSLQIALNIIKHQTLGSELLIQRCKENDRKAQEALFKLYAPAMMSVCLRYVKHFHDAEELMLDGFNKFFKTVSAFVYSSENALSAYLKKIIVNECLMFLRKKRMLITDIETEDAGEVSTDETITSKLSADEIFKQIVQLPDGYRTVFNLYAVENYSHAEIAALLQISSGTSKSQLSKARFMLQKMILKNE